MSNIREVPGDEAAKKNPRLVITGKTKWSKYREDNHNVSPPNKDGSVDHTYQTDIHITDEQDFLRLKKKYKLHPLVNLKEDPETGENYLTVKAKTFTKTGQSLEPPMVVGPDN